MTKQGRYKQSGEQSKKHVHVSENGDIQEINPAAPSRRNVVDASILTSPMQSS